jgi:transcriptional regulator with XRE-family HTH domain
MTGLELKVARIKQGRKQIEVAREVGIHPTRLSRIENDWEQPRPDELAAIRATLKLDERLSESQQAASSAK